MTRALSQLMKLFLIVGCLAVAAPAFAGKNDNNIKKNGKNHTNNYNHNGKNDTNNYNRNGNGTAKVPEPGTLLLLGTGLIGLAVRARKFKND